MAASPPDSTNGRVTMARLGEKLDNLIDEVRRYEASLNRRMDFLEEKHALDFDDVRNACHANAKELARLDERQSSSTNILTALTLGLSTIAGVIGSIIK
jgi:hypothetical protein